MGGIALKVVDFLGAYHIKEKKSRDTLGYCGEV